MNNKKLYNSIMERVAVTVKKAINEYGDGIAAEPSGAELKKDFMATILDIVWSINHDPLTGKAYNSVEDSVDPRDLYVSGRPVMAQADSLAKRIYDGDIVELMDANSMRYDIFIRWSDSVKLGDRNVGEPGFEWCWGGDFD